MKLHCVLTEHWYNEVESGRKSVEYRSMTDYWRKRIWEKRDLLDRVVFSRGYTSATITRRITKIDIGPCPYPEWDGEYYRVHFEPVEVKQ